MIPCNYNASFDKQRTLSPLRGWRAIWESLEAHFDKQNVVTLSRCIELAYNVDYATSKALKVKEVKPAAEKPEFIGAVKKLNEYHNNNKHKPRFKWKHEH